MRFSDVHYRRLAAGTCLMAGPALTLVGWSLVPSVDSDQAEWVSEIAAAPERSAAGIALAAVGMALLIPAYLALAHLLRERRPLLGDIGGALSVFGGVLIAGLMGLALAEVEAIRHLGDTAGTIAVIEAIDESVASLVLFLGPLLATAGLVVLAVGLVRAHVVPAPLALLFGAGSLVQLFGFIALSSVAIGVVGFAMVFLGLAGIGLQVLTETDDEWEHAPLFEGFSFHRASTA